MREHGAEHPPGSPQVLSRVFVQLPDLLQGGGTACDVQCGDGVVSSGEECDPPGQDTCAGGAACGGSCQCPLPTTTTSNPTVTTSTVSSTIPSTTSTTTSTTTTATTTTTTTTPVPPSCSNGFEDGTETDVDCGGDTCPPCQGGMRCNGGSDCQSTFCAGGICTSGLTTSLQLTGIGNAVAGTQQSATVTAFDDTGNVAPGYHGTVHFASNDPKALLPGYPPAPFGGQPVQDYTFTAADAGTHTFANGVVLETALSPNSLVTVTDVDDPSLTSSQQPVVSPGPARNITIGLPQTKANYPAWSGFGVSETFCGADASDLYGNRTPATLTWSSSDPAALLPRNYTVDPAEPVLLEQCDFATVGLQTVTVAVASNPTVKAFDTVNVIDGPQANPDDVTLLDPAHAYGITRWPINVLENDDQVKLDVFNPFLDFYNTIFSVEQATYSDNGTLYQVGLMTVSGDLHFVVWDLDPPADVMPTVAGAQMLRCPAPDAQGGVSSICTITAPITAGYTMTDSANFTSATLTLHMETPNSPVTPLSSTLTFEPITISTDASKRATISPQLGINMPVMQTIMLTANTTTTTSTTTITPPTTSSTTSTPTSTTLPLGAVSVNINFDNVVTSSNGAGCTGGLQNCTVSSPVSAPSQLTAPSLLGTLTAGVNSILQGQVFAAPPQSLHYTTSVSCQLETNALSDLFAAAPDGANCSVNSNCDTVVNKGDGVCTNGVLHAGARATRVLGEQRLRHGSWQERRRLRRDGEVHEG